MRAIAVVCLVALLSACATPARAPRPAPAPPKVVVPPPPPSPEPLPAVPPASIGPRAEAPADQPAEPPRAEPAAAPPPSIAPEVPAAARGRFIVLNFDNADIETVIQAASEIIGFNYVLAPDVRAKVTVQTSGRIAQEDVFGVLLAILEVHGFTAIKAGNLYKIVRIEGARERAVPTIVGQQPDPNRTTDEIITQIVPLKYSSAADLSAILNPLKSQRGSLIVHRETNVLIITDTASNMRRLLDIVRLVDVQIAQEELAIIPIRFADATQLAGILNQLFASGRVRMTAPGTPPPPAAPPGAPPAAPGAAAQPGAAAERPPLIIAEQRSNSLIIHAKKHELETIRRLIGQLDVNIYGGRRVFIYYAENAKAKDLTATLNAIYGREAGAAPAPTPAPPRPGAPPAPPPTPPPAAGPPGAAVAVGEVGVTEGQVKFIADEVTNSIIVTTYPRLWQEIEGTIKLLDRMPRQVLIEVLVAEITLSDDTRLGIDWAVRTGRFSLGGTTSNTATVTAIPTSPIPGGGTLSAPSSVLPPAGAFGPIAAGLTAFTFQTDRFFAILNALASEDKINVISSPHVLTSENKKAVINVSTSIPIVTSQAATLGGIGTTGTGTTPTVVGQQTIEYRDAGVILTVTPRIGERGTVALDVKQEVNDIGGPEPPTGSRRINKREAETSVVLVNNQTLVLGGLITDRREFIRRGIPLLRDIPVLGYLFGFTEQIVDKRELLILITPRVLGTALDAAKITEQMRRATPDLDQAIKQAPRPPSAAPPPDAPAPAPAPATPPAPAPAPSQ